jgi:hypothetical protein
MEGRSIKGYDAAIVEGKKAFFGKRKPKFTGQ